MNMMRIALGASLAVVLATACGDSDDTTPDTGTAPTDTGTGPTDTGTGPADTGPGPADTGPADGGGGGGFTQPPDTVPVNFTIDDSNNRSFIAADGLAWKGSFNYDSTTRILQLDTGWGGPFPMVFDDGPWDEGGHEPAGSMAGDNIWGVTVFVAVPTEAPVNFEYGAISGSTNGSDGDWIWGLQSPTNGNFSVPVGAADAINAMGLEIPAWGDVDFRVTINVAMAADPFGATFDPSAMGIQIKSSHWGWSLQDMRDDGMRGDQTAGDGIYTFQMLENSGMGRPLRNFGGMNRGATAQFVLEFRRGMQGEEYKGLVEIDGSEVNAGLLDGVTAEIRVGTGDWTPVTIARAGNDNNPAINAPGR